MWKRILLPTLGLMVLTVGLLWVNFGGDTQPVVQDPRPLEAPAPVPTSVEKAPAPPKVASEPIPTPAPVFTLNPGMMAYRFAMSAEGYMDMLLLAQKMFPQDVDPGQASRNDVTTRISGDLYLKVYPLNPKGTWKVSGRIENLLLLLNNSQQEYAQAVEFPFLFEVDQQGQQSGLTLPRGTPREAITTISQILSGLNLSFGEGSEWEAEEEDGMGRYTAVYQLQERPGPAFELSKRRVRYNQLNGTGALEQTNRLNVKSSTFHLEFAAPTWPVKVTGTEQTESTVQGKVWSVLDSELLMEQIDAQPRSVLPGNEVAARALLRSPEFSGREFATIPALNRMTQGKTIEEVVKIFLKALSGESQAEQNIARALIRNHLRLAPEAAFSLLDFLNSQESRALLHQEARLRLWFYLARADTHESRQALVQGMGPDYEYITRWRSTQHLFDVENPEPFMTTETWKTFKRLQTEPAPKVQDLELKNMTVLAYGALGGALEESERARIRVNLEQELRVTQDPREVSVLLSAVSNLSDENTLSIIRPYLSASETRVRISAFESMRNLSGEETLQTFQQYYYQEQDPVVRTRALEALERMPQTEQSIQWAREELQRVEAPKQQVALVQVLAKDLKTYPENEESLRLLLATKMLSNETKRAIYRHIPPQR